MDPTTQNLRRNLLTTLAVAAITASTVARAEPPTHETTTYAGKTDTHIVTIKESKPLSAQYFPAIWIRATATGDVPLKDIVGYDDKIDKQWDVLRVVTAEHPDGCLRDHPRAASRCSSAIDAAAITQLEKIIETVKVPQNKTYVEQETRKY